MPVSAYHHVFEPGSDPASPPLLLLHGTGGNEHDLLRIGRTISPGSALLSPRGDVNEGGALRFFARVAEGVFDPTEVTKRAHALADFVVAASKRYGLAPDRLTAVGLSNGANIAATMLLLRPEVLGAAILFRPMVVLDQPAAPGSLAGKRILISSGSVDPLVTPSQLVHLAELFRAGGAEVTQKTHPASHALVQADVTGAQNWLRAEGVATR